MSTREIAKKLGVAKSTITEWMEKSGIPRRNRQTSAKLAAKHGISFNTSFLDPSEDDSVITLDDIIGSLKDKVSPTKYEPVSRENISIPLPLKMLESGDKKQKITLTLVMSDLHLGHESHLPETFWSTLSNLERVLKYLKEHSSIEKFNIVCNGDMVSGKDVYEYQVFQNLVQRGHWQIFLAERILKKTIEQLEKYVKVNKVYLIKGTHEAREFNFMLSLKKCMDHLAKYCSKYLILNIGEPLGNYNVLFTHGFGRSTYFPVSGQFVTDMWKSLGQLKVPIERVITAHSHWLTPDVQLEGFKVSVSGGFQKWEYTIQQRPAGMLLLLYNEGECSVIPIKPDKQVEEAERNEPALEYKNLCYYGQILKEHFQLYEEE